MWRGLICGMVSILATACTLFLTPGHPDSGTPGDDADLYSAGDVRRDSGDDEPDVESRDADARDEEEAAPLPGSCDDLFAADKMLGDGTYIIYVDDAEVSVYCDMTDDGGWTQVVDLDFAVDECPGDWAAGDVPDVCRVERPSCDVNVISAEFSSPQGAYSEVRGFFRGYQYFSMDGFNTQLPMPDIDTAYVEGVSVTHGADPRHHIWTLAVGLSQLGGGGACPCAGGVAPPEFVGQDYHCDSGNPESYWDRQWYVNDRLWEGGTDGACDELEDPAWFAKALEGPTDDPIEVRILFNGCDENVGITEMELYVR